MRAALVAARRALGRTRPNPAVGAVIVRDGIIQALGMHRAAGRPHAEIEALNALSDPALAKGATIYITLEPCSTHGKTPPCTEAILAAGFARVVFGTRDPNPKHSGRARSILEAAGIQVVEGILEAECCNLNRGWNHWIVRQTPFVTAKCGMTLDGRISSRPDHRWITSAAARRDAMQLRAEHDAILVGGATIRDDNPKLTVRGIRGARQPIRVVWSESGNLPTDAHVFSDENRDQTRVVIGKSLAETLSDLGRDGITSVLIEGGGRTLGEAFDQGLVQRVVFYMAPDFSGGPTPAVGGIGVDHSGAGLKLDNLSVTRIGRDLRFDGVVGSA